MKQIFTCIPKFRGVRTSGGFSIRAAAAVTALMLMASAAYADSFVSGNYVFETSGANVCKLTSANEPGTIAELTIPSTVVYNETTYSVTAIGANACKDVTTATSITIPETVTTIGANAFFGCIAAETLVIGEGVTNIERQAFDACNALNLVICKATTAPTTATIVFSLTTLSKANLQVPESAMSSYKNPFFVWGEFEKISAIGTAIEPEEPEEPGDKENHKLVFWSSVPSNGSTVKQISSIRAAFELSSADADTDIISPIADKVSEITLTDVAGNEIKPLSANFVESSPINTVEIKFPKQTAEGKYTLTIPAGCIGRMTWKQEEGKTEGAFELVEGMTNSKIEITINVSPSMTTSFNSYTLRPADGAIVGKINTVELSFPQAPYALDIDESKEITLSNGNVTYKAEIGGWGNERRLTFNSDNDTNITITENGEWHLTVPEGVFSANGEENDEIKATYTISDDAEYRYTFSPLNLSKVDIPEGHPFSFQIDFPDATEVTNNIAGISKDGLLTIKYGDQALSRVANSTVSDGYQLVDNGNSAYIEIRISESIFDHPDILYVTAKKGAFKVDGIDSPEIAYTLNFGVDKTFAKSVSPESGTYKNLDTFRVSFPDATEAEYQPESLIILFQGRNAFCRDCTVTRVSDATAPTFDIVFTPGPSVLGDYDLTVDEGAFILDGIYPSPRITGKYTLATQTAIHEIEVGDRETVTVYGIDGRVILKDRSRAELRSLDPGVYIVNGRKLIIPRK